MAIDPKAVRTRVRPTRSRGTGWMMVAVAVAALAGSQGCRATPDITTVSNATTGDAAAADTVARGKYLVDIGGCNDCHTPLKMGANGPEPDMSRYLSGHPEGMQMAPAPRLDMPWMYAGSVTNTAFAGPWGVSYAINLTSHETTGLGQWTEDGFVRAFRTGRHLGIPTGRMIMPPMPWPAFSKMTDADLKTVFAYLRTVPGIRNSVPDAIVALAIPPDSAGAPPAHASPAR